MSMVENSVVNLFLLFLQIQQTLQAQGRCHSNSLSLAIACYLVQLGCDPELRNRKGKTAADIVADATVWDTLISYVNRRNDLLSAENGAVSPVLVQDESCKKEEQSALIAVTDLYAKECIVCCEMVPDIRFEPCGHINACSHCAPRMKKCLECHVLIVTKTSSGTPLNYSSSVMNCEMIQGYVGSIRFLDPS